MFSLTQTDNMQGQQMLLFVMINIGDIYHVALKHTSGENLQDLLGSLSDHGHQELLLALSCPENVRSLCETLQ